MKIIRQAITLFVCLLSSTSDVFSDQTEESTVEIQWKKSIAVFLSHEQIREETLHKLRNQGPGLSLQMQLKRQTQNSEHRFGFELPIGLLLDRYDYWGISLHYGINVRGLWKIQPTLLLGYFASVNVRDYYYPEWDDSHLYWLTDYSTGPAIAYRPKKYPKFSLLANVSLFSFVSRSPQHPSNKLDKFVTFSGFFTISQKNLEWRDIRDFQSGTIAVFYQSNPANKTRWNYRIQFVRLDDPLKFVEVKHLLGWNYDF